MSRPAHALVAIATGSIAGLAAAGTPVQVVLDLDASTPGMQAEITVPACQSVIADVAVYIIDPLELRSIWTMGYLGGIDRGLALGHTPDPATNVGTVTTLSASLGTTVNPANFGWVVESPALDPGFAGPEVQYVEFGAGVPAVIPAAPAAPIFTVDVVLDGAAAGDEFRFYLLDFVTVWTGGAGGAFSTQGPIITLDTGGDAVADATDTLHGTDPDTPVPAPPAAFEVDFVDGPPGGGPARIIIAATAGDADGNGVVNGSDIVEIILSWGPCRDCPADLDGDGKVGGADLVEVILQWGVCEQ